MNRSRGLRNLLVVLVAAARAGRLRVGRRGAAVDRHRRVGRRLLRLRGRHRRADRRAPGRLPGHRRGHLGLGRQHVPDRRRQSDLAFALADTAADAVRGTDTFDGEQVQAQALARLYNNLTQVATVKGKGISSVEDLKGKRVSVGSPGSGTEVIALRVLEAAGLDPDDDISRQQLGVGESVQAVKDGALDAFFWSGGVPTSAVTDLATTRELLLLPTDQYVDELKERYGDFYAAAEIEAGGYEGVEAPVKVVAVPNYLVVNRSMDPELAYQLTRLLFDQKEALTEVHPAARRLELETAPKVAPLQLHPGAQRYYDEQAKT